ncbi:ATP-binding protein [Streptomyces cylindrosporus]|uniref:ATP-binding protein n=1 Tax=Streptomyces cylindrosporus TaxID=2927583 RepID=A0ABS9Y6C2_9ACTN|nr:ATP-binding protein [Streptomyces cylindrosporus]MCI3272766.1 ATP-binding protein [Streptomyces cylindrosporus]
MLQLSGSPRPDHDPQHAGHLSVEYDPRPTAVREARVEVRRQLERWGLSGWDAAGDGDRAGGDLVDVTELLVSELVTNALLHSRSRFRLTLSAAHGVLRCEVSDSGRRVPRVVAAGTSENGRGMFLVDALALRWGCHQDGPGKTVWFELGTRGLDGCGRRQP